MERLRQIKGAIFDLDGTLLDSMGIWEQIDAQFLERRGIPLPPDYAEAVKAMEFSQAAEYTIRRFGLQETPQALMEEFMSSFRRSEPAGAGVRLSAGAGWVYVAPLVRRPAVQVLAEGENAEIAEELCVFYENEVRRLDGQLGG